MATMPEPAVAAEESVRSRIGAAHRVVVKVGSSSLTTPEGGLAPSRLQRLVDALADARDRNREVVLVSSGAIATGLMPLGLQERPRDLATQQAAASVGQGLLVAHYTRRFLERGYTVGQVLLTEDDVVRRGQYRNANRTLTRLLELGVVPIINENDTVASQEIRFGDNDRLAALVAHLVRADALILLSDVDALYTDHPANPGARRIAEVRDPQDLLGVDTSRIGSRVGTGGMTTKVEAAQIATSAGIPVLLTNADQCVEALAGGDVGTCFHVTGRRRGARQLWVAHATRAEGDLVIDAGAARALTERDASLLPVGITEVRGDFHEGDPVNIVDPDNLVIARGLAGFDADDLRRMKGLTTARLLDTLGPDFGGTAVHKDALVVLPRARPL